MPVVPTLLISEKNMKMMVKTPINKMIMQKLILIITRMTKASLRIIRVNWRLLMILEVRHLTPSPTD